MVRKREKRNLISNFYFLDQFLISNNHSLVLVEFPIILLGLDAKVEKSDRHGDKAEENDNRKEQLKVSLLGHNYNLSVGVCRAPALSISNSSRSLNLSS